MRGKISEHSEQVCVIDWCNANIAKYPMLKWIYAIPNAGKHHISFRMKQMAEGLKKGVPDLCLPYPTCKRIIERIPLGNELPGYHGLYIEMKIKGGKVSKEQQEWIDFLWAGGYECKVAWSADEAIKIIEDYLCVE